MKWSKTLLKALQGFLTFVVAYLAINPNIIIDKLPSDITEMTISGGIVAVLVGLNNWLKHNKKK